eukprot:878580-Pleurochrysis_carterae.AAC.1
MEMTGKTTDAPIEDFSASDGTQQVAAIQSAARQSTPPHSRRISASARARVRGASRLGTDLRLVEVLRRRHRERAAAHVHRHVVEAA